MLLCPRLAPMRLLALHDLLPIRAVHHIKNPDLAKRDGELLMVQY